MTKSPSPKIIFIPFLVCSISMVGIFLIKNKLLNKPGKKNGESVLTFAIVISALLVVIAVIGMGFILLKFKESYSLMETRSFFFLWAVLIYKRFFAIHKKLGVAFHGFLSIAVVILIILCGMIVGQFASQGTQNLDYIIVLGAQVREDGPSVVLKYRLDAAIDYLNENPDTVCIVSGGQGANEPFSEAEGMAKYLIGNGIDEKRILLEDKSKNTVQNIQNSKEIMEETYNGVGIVTNNFHVFRATRIAKAQGLEGVYGIAADANVLYLPNNALRECCGILKDWLMKNI